MNPMQNHDTRVPDIIGSLSEADILASQQYYDHEPAVANLKEAWCSPFY